MHLRRKRSRSGRWTTAITAWNDILVELASRTRIPELHFGARARWTTNGYRTNRPSKRPPTRTDVPNFRGTQAGKRLILRRGELLERPFAHYLDGGGMRRTHSAKTRKYTRSELFLTHVAWGFNLAVDSEAGNLIDKATPKEFSTRSGSTPGESLLYCASSTRRTSHVLHPLAINMVVSTGPNLGSAESHLP